VFALIQSTQAVVGDSMLASVLSVYHPLFFYHRRSEDVRVATGVLYSERGVANVGLI